MFYGSSCSEKEMENAKRRLKNSLLTNNRIFEKEKIILKNPKSYESQEEAIFALKKLIANERSIVILANVQEGKIILYKGDVDVNVFRNKIIRKLSCLYYLVFKKGRLPLNEIVDLRKANINNPFIHDFSKN